jgi:protein SCO1/2
MKYTCYLPVLAAVLLLSCAKQPSQQQQPLCCVKPDAPETAAVASSSAASIYQLASRWTDEDREPFTLNRLAGKVQVVAMIFTHCGYACPRIVDNMKAVEEALPAADRDGTGFVLVSFDPDRDTAAVLKAYAAEKGLDGHWTLLHGTEAEVRELSMLLNVHYNALPAGNFNHSNVITVLDRTGAVAQSFSGLDINVKDVVSAIHALD